MGGLEDTGGEGEGEGAGSGDGGGGGGERETDGDGWVAGWTHDLVVSTTRHFRGLLGAFEGGEAKFLVR